MPTTNTMSATAMFAVLRYRRRDLQCGHQIQLGNPAEKKRAIRRYPCRNSDSVSRRPGSSLSTAQSSPVIIPDSTQRTAREAAAGPYVAHPPRLAGKEPQFHFGVSQTGGPTFAALSLVAGARIIMQKIFGCKILASRSAEDGT